MIKGEIRKWRHPTRKPISLSRYVIKTYTKPDDLVVDYFGGIASTGIACVREQRHFIGIEENQAFWQIGKQRLIDENS